MTEDELKMIEAYDGGDTVRDLVAEVRRLRGLIERVKTVDNDFGTLFCPWCGHGDPQHRADCPAFTESGDVR